MEDHDSVLLDSSTGEQWQGLTSTEETKYNITMQ